VASPGRGAADGLEGRSTAARTRSPISTRLGKLERDDWSFFASDRPDFAIRTEFNISLIFLAWSQIGQNFFARTMGL